MVSFYAGGTVLKTVEDEVGKVIGCTELDGSRPQSCIKCGWQCCPVKENHV